MGKQHETTSNEYLRKVGFEKNELSCDSVVSKRWMQWAPFQQHCFTGFTPTLRVFLAVTSLGCFVSLFWLRVRVAGYAGRAQREPAASQSWHSVHLLGCVEKSVWLTALTACAQCEPLPKYIHSVRRSMAWFSGAREHVGHSSRQN